MIQVELFQKNKEDELIEDVNYFLDQLQDHLFIDIKFNSIISHDHKLIYQALVIYKVI